MKRLRLFLPLSLFIVAASAPQAQTPRTSRVVNPKANEIGAAKPGIVFRDCPDCPEMVVLPAGSFTMGSSAEEKSWAASHGGSTYAVADEAPQHQVSLPSFALGKYDVTRGEYAAFARETGYPAGDGCGRGRAIFK
jgi:formylglycine-generating enzyme required for sulfatase activity